MVKGDGNVDELQHLVSTFVESIARQEMAAIETQLSRIVEWNLPGGVRVHRLFEPTRVVVDVEYDPLLANGEVLYVN